jgi:hypothetical protein
VGCVTLCAGSPIWREERLASETLFGGGDRVHAPAAANGIADLGSVGRLAAKPEDGLLGLFVEGIAS